MFARFRRVNTLLFTAAILIMAVVMSLLLNGIIARVSAEYAEQYAYSSAEALSAHIIREIDIIRLLAQSDAVVEWLHDEDDEGKMERALAEMEALVGELYSFNMYIVFESSLNQYRVGTDYAVGTIQLMDVAVLSEGVPQDEWYFTAVQAQCEYLLDIAIDEIMRRKRVWIDYTVASGGVTLGVISTGLEFSHMAGEIFAQYDRGNMRGFIIDQHGIIHMDSALMRDREFMYSEFTARIEEQITSPEVLAAIESHLGSVDGNHFDLISPVVIVAPYGQHRNVTITPIRATNWSLVILSGGTTLYDMSYFVPILATVLVLLLIVALVTSAANYRLIFLPLGKLDRSLSSLRESLEGNISGTDRDDELGELSRTIQDLFRKANIDALTGIYNRRFMENNLEHIMAVMSRSQGLLSVLMLDIDFFKKYNDSLGHDQGDECLRMVAKAISDHVTRASDFAARYGGEEFIVVLTHTDEAGAHVVAERLIESVRALNIPHPDSSAAPFVTVSIGGTSGKVVYGQEWEEFVKRADEALYMSKQNGRNKFTFIGMKSNTDHGIKN